MISSVVPANLPVTSVEYGACNAAWKSSSAAFVGSAWLAGAFSLCVSRAGRTWDAAAASLKIGEPGGRVVERGGSEPRTVRVASGPGDEMTIVSHSADAATTPAAAAGKLSREYRGRVLIGSYPRKSPKSSIVSDPAPVRPNPIEIAVAPVGTAVVVQLPWVHDDAVGSFGDWVQYTQLPELLR